MTRVTRDPAEVKEWSSAAKRNRFSTGFVPTMGALHEGHRSLMKRAWAENDLTAVSIYVNPLQFGPNEDFDRYPRAFEQDLAMCEAEKVDLVFAPTVDAMKPNGYATRVTVSGLSERFEGARRPGHFDGVATIVTALLSAVAPSRAYFGQKDLQQTVVVRRLVTDLLLPTAIVVCPTVRDPDGLAMSSRNVYLSKEDRVEALRLPRALARAAAAISAGERSAERLRSIMADDLTSPRADVEAEYADVVDPDTLMPLADVAQSAALLAVLRVGRVRLLDNRLVTFPDGGRS